MRHIRTFRYLTALSAALILTFLAASCATTANTTVTTAASALTTAPRRARRGTQLPAAAARLEAAAREPEFDKRRQSFLRFQEIIARDRPSLELGPNPNVIVADRRLRDVDVNAGGIRGSFSATWLARS